MDTATEPLIPAHVTPPEQPLRLGGFLRAIRTNVITMWTAQAYHDDVVERRFFGRVNLLVNKPEAIRHVLVENSGNYRRSPASIRILRPLVGRGLFLSEGDVWRAQRRTTAPALAPRVLPLLARHVVEATNQQLPGLASTASAGPVDLLAAMQLLALEIAGRSMFSLETARFAPAMRQLLRDFGTDLSRANLFDMVLPASVTTLRDLRRRRFQARWMALIETIMDARDAAPAGAAPRDLFDLLRAARDPETGLAFERDILRDQVATLLLAGHETTALTLFWALTLLAQAPAEQARVAAEAQSVSITADTGYASLAHLPHTQAVIQECLRLYPPAFLMIRQAIGPDRFADTGIRKGAIVMIAPWVLHRQERFWPDPLAFRPDRFAPGASPPARFTYLPFGAGPRVCVGAQFALMEATLVLAMLIGRFRISLEGDRPILPVAIVTTQPDHAPGFKLCAR